DGNAVRLLQHRALEDLADLARCDRQHEARQKHEQALHGADAGDSEETEVVLPAEEPEEVVGARESDGHEHRAPRELDHGVANLPDAGVDNRDSIKEYAEQHRGDGAPGCRGHLRTVGKNRHTQYATHAPITAAPRAMIAHAGTESCPRARPSGGRSTTRVAVP